MNMSIKALKQLFVALALSVLTVGAAQAQRVETSIDRDEVVRGSTITMEVRIYDRQGTVPIDISPLQDGFDIVSTRSSSQLRTVNNRVQASTTYRLVLFPLKVGAQEIPSIEIGDHNTDPIAINVLSEPERASSDPQVRLETSLSTDELYVQEQLLFTVRLYYTISGIRNPNFTEPDMENTVVQMLGPPNQYEQLIDGERYGVYEMNYAIFPQRSGEIEIPDIVFRGQVSDGSSRYVFRNANVDPVTAFSEGYTVNVKPRPENYPAGTWLPGTSLTVEDEWNSDRRSLETGESLERTVRITVVGMDGAALPSLSAPDIDGMSVYQEPADIGRRIIDGNVVGTRTERFSYVATEPGSISIPEVRIPWWNTQEDQLAFAVIPGTHINISEPPGSTSPVATTTASDVSVQADESREQSMLEDQLVSSARTPTWIVVTIGIALALLALLLLWQRRRQTAYTEPTEPVRIAISPAYQHEIAEDLEKSAFVDFEKACKEGHAGRIRLLLIAWGRQYFKDDQLHTLDALAQRSGEQNVADACKALQSVLYGRTSSGDSLPPALRDQLLNTFRALRETDRKQRKTRAKEAAYKLPPLYRS